MSLKKSRALVLRKFRSGEKDLVAELLLENGERQSLRLHGIFGSKSRTPLIGEPGSLIEIDYYEGSREELSLREGIVIRRHDALKKDYISQDFLAKILTLARIAASGAADPSLFRLLRSALQFADEMLLGPGATEGEAAPADPHRIEAFLLFFTVRILDSMGLLADPTHCASCDRELKSAAAFGDGAFFLCEGCSGMADELSMTCAREILRMQQERYRELVGHVEGLDPAVFDRLKSGLQRALRFTLPDPPQIFF